MLMKLRDEESETKIKVIVESIQFEFEYFEKFELGQIENFFLMMMLKDLALLYLSERHYANHEELSNQDDIELHIKGLIRKRVKFSIY